MTILITGASGFIGRKLTARLSADGYNVVCLSRTRFDADAAFVQGAFDDAETIIPARQPTPTGLANRSSKS